MFQKICIKSKEKDTQKVDISFLLDSMLFYGKVIVLAHKEEVITLLRYLGEDFLTELIISGRLELKVRENILGSMSFPDDKYGIGLFEGRGKSYSAILYEAHRESVKNSVSNQKFSDNFAKITQPFQYTTDITEQIKADFENENLLKKLLPIYMNATLPQFQLPNELSIEIVKDNSFGPFDAYTLNTNIDIKKFNELSRELKGDDHHVFNYSGFLLALSESQGDIFIASHFESELVTNKLYSDFISQQLEDLIRRRSKSEENLHLFGEYILENCHPLWRKRPLVPIPTILYLTTLFLLHNLLRYYKRNLAQKKQNLKLPGFDANIPISALSCSCPKALSDGCPVAIVESLYCSRSSSLPVPSSITTTLSCFPVDVPQSLSSTF